MYASVPDCNVRGFVPWQGGNVLAGYSNYGTDSSLMNLLFLNDSDNVVSHKEFNTATHLDFMSCIIPAANGFLIGGKSSDPNFFHPQLIRTDATGNVLWAKYIDNTSFWHGQIIRILPNGNNFSMYTFAETPTNDLFRIETDASGNFSPGIKSVPNIPMSFRVLDAERFYSSLASSHILCGHGNFNSSTTRGGLLMKTNPSGVEWCKHITAGGNFKNDIVDVITTSGEDSYSVFVCENMPGNQYSTIVMKFDSLGNKIWAKQLALANGSLNGCSIVKTNDIFIASYDNLLNAYITQITEAGVVIRTQKWLPSSAGGATGLNLSTYANGILFTGMLNNNYFVARLDADATGCNFVNTNLINVTTPVTVLTDIPFTNTPFTATAVSEPVTYSSVSYTESLICNGVGVEEIESGKVLQIYPVPASNRININSSIPTNNFSKLEIFNAFGNCVLTRGYDRNEIDVSAFASGMYLLKITTAGKIYGSRFIKE